MFSDISPKKFEKSFVLLACLEMFIPLQLAVFPSTVYLSLSFICLSSNSRV